MRFLETFFELVGIYGMFFTLSFKSMSSELVMDEKLLGYRKGIYLLLRIDYPFSEYLYLIQSCRMHCTH